MYKMILKITLACSFLLLSSIGSAAPITLTGAGALNVDTPAPTLLNINTAITGIITDLNLYIDLDAACCAYDNTVILSHLDTGKSATIWIDGNTSGFTFGDVRDTTFDDEAATAFTSAAQTINGFDLDPGFSYQSLNLLSVFDGDSLSGTWQLSIQNTGCCTNEGDDLISWAVVAEVPEPASILIFTMALAGLRVSRRKIAIAA